VPVGPTSSCESVDPQRSRHVLRSMVTILRIFLMGELLRIFAILSMLPGLAGVVLLLRHSTLLIGDGPVVQSVIAGSALGLGISGVLLAVGRSDRPGSAPWRTRHHTRRLSTVVAPLQSALKRLQKSVTLIPEPRPILPRPPRHDHGPPCDGRSWPGIHGPAGRHCGRGHPAGAAGFGISAGCRPGTVGTAVRVVWVGTNSPGSCADP
jgi:hypothetical protein